MRIEQFVSVCDDCQLVCPWNRFAEYTNEIDFQPRHDLDTLSLLECFAWTSDDFYRKMEGSAIRRIGFECWQRNIVVALGNAAYDPYIIDTLKRHYEQCSPLVQHHIDWAIEQQTSKHP